MAMGAVAAHKLRSALTLLGVLVGVFSIIVVMTAMRAMQKTNRDERSTAWVAKRLWFQNGREFSLAGRLMLAKILAAKGTHRDTRPHTHHACHTAV